MVLMVALAAGSNAQEDSIWTLQRCIDRAIEHNLDMKRQELLVASASQDVTQRKMDLLPNLNGSVEHQLGSGRVLDRGTYEWKNASVSQGDLGLQSDLTIFEGLQGLNNMKMSKASYQMSREELESLEDELTIQVMTQYLTLLRNEELVEVAELNVEVTLQQVERMERLVEVGNEARGKLLEVKAQLSDAELSLTQAANEREISRLNLMHLMNMTSKTVLEIVRPEMADPSESDIPHFDTVFQYAVMTLPYIKSAEYGIRAQEHNLAVQRGGRSPRLYVRGLYYSNYSDGLVNPLDPDPSNPTLDYPLSDQITNNQYRQVAMGIQIPFFNRWQVQTNINKAKISLQDAEYQYDNAVLNLQKSVQQYHTAALAALDNYRSAGESVANSTEAYRFAEERFRVGTGTALELQEARNQLYRSTSEMITSRYELVFYTKILDFYMGKEIVF